MNTQLARTAIGLVDLTDLSDACTPEDIEQLCQRAVEHGTAAVCVWPGFVRQAKSLVTSSAVKVATVVNFPSGDGAVRDVASLTEAALNDGADEIDVVLPYTTFLSGEQEASAAMIVAVRAIADRDNTLKVILETGELAKPELISAAATLAIDWGADFIKTSTGKSPVSAKPHAVELMLDAIVAERDADHGRLVGLKPSGGIRTVADAKVYLDLAEQACGADYLHPDTFRFGASGLLDALLAAAAGTSAATTETAGY